MRKEIALVLTTLLILTALVTTSYFTPPAASQGEGNHWKIMLAQKGCNAWITGYLTSGGIEIPGTAFFLNCTCGKEEPQPAEFVFWKVWTPPDKYPDDIHYIKSIDEDKDPLTPPIEVPIDHSIPYNPEEPHTVYEHVEVGEGLLGPWMVVVEVREQPYDPERPIFEWQLMMKTHGVNASWSGFLTEDAAKLDGTDFYLETVGVDPDLQCQVVDGNGVRCLTTLTPS